MCIIIIIPLFFIPGLKFYPNEQSSITKIANLKD